MKIWFGLLGFILVSGQVEAKSSPCLSPQYPLIRYVFLEGMDPETAAPLEENDSERSFHDLFHSVAVEKLLAECGRNVTRSGDPETANMVVTAVESKGTTLHEVFKSADGKIHIAFLYGPNIKQPITRLAVVERLRSAWTAALAVSWQR